MSTDLPARRLVADPDAGPARQVALARTGWPAGVGLAAFAVVVVLFVVGLAALAGSPPPLSGSAGQWAWALSLLGFPAVGALVIARRPTHRLGWLLTAVGVSFGGALALTGVGALLDLADPVAGPLLPTLIGDALWKTGFLSIALVVLLFPTGRLPSRRWVPVAVALLVLWAGAVLAGLVRAGTVDDVLLRPNPWAVPWLSGALGILDEAPGFAAFAVLLVVCVASVPVRLRSAQGRTRAQLLWFAAGGLVVAVAEVGSALLQLALPRTRDVPAWDVVEALGFLGLAAAIAVAMLRHRLYEVDRVLSRTLALVTVFVVATGLYVGLVVGLGALLSRTPALGGTSPFLAAAVLAAAFHPLRTRVLRAADRLVLGRRASPYELLADTTRRVAATLGDEEALPAVVRSLAEAIEATVSIWVTTSQGWHRAATWTEAVSGVPPDPAGGPEPDEAASFDVRHAGQRLGVLTVERAVPLTAVEHRLAADLAAQAGIVVRNGALDAELRDRLAELRALAGRLVHAGDTARRQLERDLHDGAQQRLTGVALKIGLARTLLPTDPAAASAVLDELAADTRAAVTEVRDLARGIHPPLLAAQGLAVALAARCRTSPVPVELDVAPVRLPAEIEAALYFCCGEALQNVVKHASADRARIEVRVEAGAARFRVTDDGVGLDPERTARGTGLQGISDRVVALGGTSRVTTEPGGGTLVEGVLPVDGVD